MPTSCALAIMGTLRLSNSEAPGGIVLVLRELALWHTPAANSEVWMLSLSVGPQPNGQH